MKRQTLALTLAFGAIAAIAVAFVIARNSRQRSLLTSMPTVALDQFTPTAKKFIADAMEKVEREPLRVDRWGDLGYALAGNNAPLEAARAFARAEELDPGNYRWPHLIAVASIKADRPTANEALKRSHKLLPNVTATLALLVDSYLEDGAYKEADALLRPLVTEKTEDQRLLLLMARIEAEAGATDKAIALAERSAAMPPRRREVHQLLLQLHRRKNDAVQVQRHARLLELLPKADEEPAWPDPIRAQALNYVRSVDAVAAQARGFAMQQQPDEAIRIVNELTPEERTAPACAAALAMARAQRREFDAAAEVLDSVKSQDDPNVLFAKGYIALLQEKFAEAAGLFEKTAAAPSTQVGGRAVDAAHLYRGLCLSELKKDDEALAAYEQALKINPGNYEAILRSSELYLKKNRKADAAKILADAALLDPTDDRVKELQRRAMN